jgi:hypothetical protein
MERAIEVLVVVQLVVVGLSHMVQHRAWAEFFIWLRAKGRAGVFANGFLSLWVGTLIVAFHPVWTGIPLLLTVFGVMNVFKATTAFLVPSWGLRSMERISLERSWIFVPAGAIMLVFAAVLGYGLVRA